MGRISIRHFPKENTNGQQVNENMLNITNDQTNVNQKQEMSPKICQNYYYQSKKKLISIDQNVAKREPSSSVDQYVNFQSP